MEGEKGSCARLCPSPSCAPPSGPAPPGQLPAAAPPLPKSAVRLCRTRRGSGLRTRDSSQARSGRRAVGRLVGTWTKRSCCRCSGAQRAALRFPTASGGTPWRCRIPAAALRRIPAASPRAKPPRYASLRRSAITPLISKTKGFSYSTSPEVQTFTCSDPERTPKGTNFRLLDRGSFSNQTKQTQIRLGRLSKNDGGVPTVTGVCASSFVYAGRRGAGPHGITPADRLATSALGVSRAKAAQAGFPHRGQPPRPASARLWASGALGRTWSQITSYAQSQRYCA